MLDSNSQDKTNESTTSDDTPQMQADGTISATDPDSMVDWECQRRYSMLI